MRSSSASAVCVERQGQRGITVRHALAEQRGSGRGQHLARAGCRRQPPGVLGDRPPRPVERRPAGDVREDGIPVARDEREGDGIRDAARHRAERHPLTQHGREVQEPRRRECLIPVAGLVDHRPHECRDVARGAVAEREPSVVPAAPGELPPVAEREAHPVRRPHQPDGGRPLLGDLALELPGDLRAEADEERQHEREVRLRRSLQLPCELDHRPDALGVRKDVGDALERLDPRSRALSGTQPEQDASRLRDELHAQRRRMWRRRCGERLETVLPVEEELQPAREPDLVVVTTRLRRPPLATREQPPVTERPVEARAIEVPATVECRDRRRRAIEAVGVHGHAEQVAELAHRGHTRLVDRVPETRQPAAPDAEAVRGDATSGRTRRRARSRGRDPTRPAGSRASRPSRAGRPTRDASHPARRRPTRVATSRYAAAHGERKAPRPVRASNRCTKSVVRPTGRTPPSSRIEPSRVGRCPSRPSRSTSTGSGWP